MYTPKHYKDLNKSSVESLIRKDGFNPLLIGDAPGTAYPPHRHPESKLLAFIIGSMKVMIEGERFDCIPGDRVLIPGNIVHAAMVGPDGCEFFWSERMD